MSDSGTTEPERKAQGAFRLKEVLGLLLLLVAIGLFDRLLAFVPNRDELGLTSATLQFTPVTLEARNFGPFQLAGAWEVRSEDPRVGGISALAVDRGDLVALSDSGAVIRFGAPRGPLGEVEISEVPDGPGSGRFKRNRDSEALVRDPQGRGWWVAFENRHELWLYDDGFDHALERIELGSDRWRANKGVEAIATDGRDLLLIPESGQSILRVKGSRAREIPTGDSRGRISDVAAISPGRFIAVERRLTPFGFGNSLVLLHRDGNSYRFGERIALQLRPIDNVEAIAVQRLPNGNRRLWLMTDDNFQPPLRTLLVALELPGQGRARRFRRPRLPWPSSPARA